MHFKQKLRSATMLSRRPSDVMEDQVDATITLRIHRIGKVRAIHVWEARFTQHMSDEFITHIIQRLSGRSQSRTLKDDMASTGGGIVFAALFTHDDGQKLTS
jgi:hypothetical protein